jgi:hypothetical protein
MADDLVVKISGDTKDFKKALENVIVQTADLNQALGQIAEVAGKAFEFFRGQIVDSLKAFEEADASSRALSTSLQNQGIFTTQLKEKYAEYAQQVQKVTGLEADNVTKAQAVAQSFLGQIPVTEKLTFAIADLAQAQGISLTQAAETLGKAISNGTGALLREGLQVSATSSESERYAKVLDFVKVKYGDQAAAANQGLGSLRGLEAAFKDTQQELGQRFAPAVTLVVKTLTEFLTPAKKSNEVLIDLKAVLLATGLVVAALGVGLPILAQGLLAVRAAAIAFNITLSATRIALAGLGIGLLIVALTELVIHFDAISARTKVIVKGMVEFISGAFDGLGKVISGALHFDKTKIAEGIQEIQDAFKEGVATAAGEIPKATEKALEEQDAVKKKFADKEAARRAEQEGIRKALQKAEDEAILLELKNASDAAIEIKKKEIETLKALEQSKNEEQRGLLKQRLSQLRDDETAQQAEDVEREKAFAEELNAAKEEHGNESVQITTEAQKKEIKAIQASEDTQKTAQNKVFQEDLKDRVKRHNTFLQEQIKYGTAYATINETINSKEVQGVKSATGDLVQLTQSKNSTLKTIGKIATVSQIVIKTAEAAMNIYAGFSAIPIIGPALGIAGAAAAIAFGAEQIGNVTAAKSGAVVEGVGFGDKIPFLLEPGELVTPRKNFDEVVNSVAQSRSFTELESGGNTNVNVNIGFNGPEASRVLTALRAEDKSLGTYRSSF